MNLTAKAKPRVIIQAVIIRKDSTREDLGTIADSKNNTVQTSNGFLNKLKGLVK